ncbi:hypothetical protein N7541_006339 [Penicillium brevicompactum]|uniref:Uncharacterized protein n=1 Tax=Penicillium brevicompactum TaxID=5074 RepID=A0A9W9R6G5_PENBR|nr:hypothetical protein N7541_006339 [Penicillium brevicompactum]
MSSPAPDSKGESSEKDTNFRLLLEDLDRLLPRIPPYRPTFMNRIKRRVCLGYKSRIERRERCRELIDLLHEEIESMYEETDKTIKFKADVRELLLKAGNNEVAPDTSPRQPEAAISTSSPSTPIENSDNIDLDFITSLRCTSLHRLSLLLKVVMYEDHQIQRDMRESHMLFSLQVAGINWFWVLILFCGLPEWLKLFATVVNFGLSCLLWHESYELDGAKIFHGMWKSASTPANSG